MAARAVAALSLALLACTPTQVGDGFMLASAETRPCMTLEAREKIRELTLQGLDEAMRSRSEKLFETWMADTTKQPERAQTGIQKAAEAYALSLRLVAEWDPPIC